MRIVIPSNASIRRYPGNTLTTFSAELATPLELGPGSYEIGLAEIQFTRSWLNVKDCWVEIIYENAPGKRKYWVKEGFYTEGKSFIESVNETIKRQRRDYGDISKKISFEYDSVEQIVTINISRNQHHVRVILSENLRRIMGFASNELSTREKLRIMNKEEVEGDNFGLHMRAESHFDINAGFYNIYVYCDLAERVPVGDTETPLLRIIPITSSNTQQQSTTFTKIQYVPVAKQYTKTITILLRTDYGDPIPFAYGKTVVTVDIRKVRHLNLL